MEMQQSVEVQGIRISRVFAQYPLITGSGFFQPAGLMGGDGIGEGGSGFGHAVILEALHYDLRTLDSIRSAV